VQSACNSGNSIAQFHRFTGRDLDLLHSGCLEYSQSVRPKLKFPVILTLVAALLVSFSLPAQADNSAWQTFPNGDHVFGYTASNYACWSIGNTSNLPILETYDGGQWVKVATGFLLSPTASLSTACSSDYPTAIGYQWTLMNPALPTYQTNGYSGLFRQRIPDLTVTTQVNSNEYINTQVTKCCNPVTTSKKVPYIKTVIKKGKKIPTLSYKTVTTIKQESYTVIEPILTPVTKSVDSTVPGYIGGSFNIYIYVSLAAEVNAAAALAHGILCAFGYGCTP